MNWSVRPVVSWSAATSRRGSPAPDCLIDFTRPQGTLEHLALCRQHKVAMVIGTTGIDDSGKAAICQRGARDPDRLFRPILSVGFNVVIKLLDAASRILNDGYDIEIVEAHHRHKVDAPSGTALRMGRGDRRCARARSQNSARFMAARGTPASATRRPSVLPRSAAATSSATIR